MTTHSSILPGELHGQRSLIGSSPWGCRARHVWATNTFTFKILLKSVLEKHSMTTNKLPKTLKGQLY